MKFGTITLIFFLLGLLFLMFIGQNATPITGKISSVSRSEKIITLTLENHSSPFIIFEDKIMKITKGDDVYILGREEKYKDTRQIIVDKISKS